jgi:hypothetical protein
MSPRPAALDPATDGGGQSARREEALMPKRWRTMAGGSFVWVIEEKQGGDWVEIARRNPPFATEDEAVAELKELRKAKRRDSKGKDHDD